MSDCARRVPARCAILLAASLAAACMRASDAPAVILPESAARAAALRAIAAAAPALSDSLGESAALCVAFEAPGPAAVGLALPVQRDADAAFLRAVRRDLSRRVLPASACMRDSASRVGPMRERAGGRRAVLVVLGPVTWQGDSAATLPASYFADGMAAAWFSCRVTRRAGVATCTVTSVVQHWTTPRPGGTFLPESRLSRARASEGPGVPRRGSCMADRTVRRGVALLWAPVAFGAATLSAALVVTTAGFLGALLQDALGLRAGWIAALAIASATGVAAIALRGLATSLYAAEGAARPGALAHLRHCVVLYAAVVVTAAWIVGCRQRAGACGPDFFGASVFVPLVALAGAAADAWSARRLRHGAPAT